VNKGEVTLNTRGCRRAHLLPRGSQNLPTENSQSQPCRKASRCKTSARISSSANRSQPIQFNLRSTGSQSPHGGDGQDPEGHERQPHLRRARHDLIARASPCWRSRSIGRGHLPWVSTPPSSAKRSRLMGGDKVTDYQRGRGDLSIRVEAPLGDFGGSCSARCHAVRSPSVQLTELRNTATSGPRRALPNRITKRRCVRSRFLPTSKEQAWVRHGLS